MIRASRAWTAAVGLAGVVVLLGACASSPLGLPEDRDTVAATLPPSTPGGSPGGSVTIAYPAEPSAFMAPVGRDLAADDLAALWGLPLLRVDDAGQVRRGLVEDWDVLGPGAGGWQVQLHLRAGEWTDGTTVDAADVVATLRARVDDDPARFGALAEVLALDPATVLLAFDRPYAAWTDLLVEVGSVLPSEVVSDGGLHGDTIGVSGGWFRLTSHEPGLRLVLEAHPDGPLGAPGLARLEVLFTPSFETALGLLEDQRVDGLVGYLPLNGVARAVDVEGVRAVSPLGGTIVSLDFRGGGSLGADARAGARRAVVASLDVAELVEGLLGPNGERATAPWPTVGAPAEQPGAEVPEGQPLALMYPDDVEVLGFTARALQRDMTVAGLAVDLVAEPAPRFAEVLAHERDAALVVRRSSRRPSLGPFVADPEVGRAAGAAVVGSPPAIEGLEAVAEGSRTAPLYRIGVLHAWRGITGMRPSAWLGAGFWNAGEWSVGGTG